MSRDQLISTLAERVVEIELGHPLRVGIDGVDASGKTVLGDELAAELRRRNRHVIRASIDGFHNPRDVRQSRGPESPEGYYLDSFNHREIAESLLSPLGPAGSRRYRKAVFDFRTDTAVDTPLETAPPDGILVFDGVFLLRPELRLFWDYSIFVAASFEITVGRAMNRDQHLFGSADDVRRRYERRYVPGQKIYLSECRPESLADAVVDNDDPSAPVLRLA
jgi:uridine kinase